MLIRPNILPDNFWEPAVTATRPVSILPCCSLLLDGEGRFHLGCPAPFCTLPVYLPCPAYLSCPGSFTACRHAGARMCRLGCQHVIYLHVTVALRASSGTARRRRSGVCVCRQAIDQWACPEQPLHCCEAAVASLSMLAVAPPGSQGAAFGFRCSRVFDMSRLGLWWSDSPGCWITYSRPLGGTKVPRQVRNPPAPVSWRQPTTCFDTLPGLASPTFTPFRHRSVRWV